MKKTFKSIVWTFVFVAMMTMQVAPAFATDGPSAVISAGKGLTFVIKKDGSLWGYGSATGGVGTGNTDTIISPVKVMDDVKSVVTNDMTSFCIKKDNSLWAWGVNGGKFGDGSSKKSDVPVKVLEDVEMVASETNYTLIIKTDGSLWGTGNVPGTLPGFDGTTIYEFKPIMPGETFKFISVCGYYAMVIKENGELWGWGNNDYSALGISGVETIKVPEKLMEQVAFVSTSSFNSMIVREDGSLYMSGTGYNGNFYDGKTVVNKINGDGIVRTPIKIMDNVLYAQTSGNRWMVVKKDGTLWGWGSDSQFGILSPLTKNTMIPVKLMSDVSYISSGTRHLIVLKKDQTLWTGGQNASGGIAGHEAAYKSYPLQLDVKDVMDAPAAWAFNDVKEAIEKGLIPTELQSDYAKPLTRKEFAKLVVTLIEKKSGKSINDFVTEKGLIIPTQTPFTDVDDFYVNAAFSLSILSGVGNNMFAPDKSINRQEAAKMLTSTAEVLGYKTDASMPIFDDVDQISSWAKPYIGYMFEIGVMKGANNRFDPKGTYVRQMAFVTMNHIFDNLK